MFITAKSNLNVAVIARALICLALASSAATTANAQSFSSGSNGSDGAFDLTGTASGSTVSFVPANFPGNQHSLGIFNFTYVTIPAGVTVRLSALNNPGPVYWLASGAVDIEGTVDLSGQAGVAASPTLDGRRRANNAGAGGFAGGVGGKTDGATSSFEPIGQPGDGPNGGVGGSLQNICSMNISDYATAGTFSGNSYLVPLIGGSGGGGGLYAGSLGSTPYAAGGGAGGGALLVASSATITVNGTITASGGAGVSGTVVTCGHNYYSGFSGPGSGGGIRLAANTITGTGIITASGGQASFVDGVNNRSNVGGPGIIRIEAFTDSFTGTITGTQTMGSPFATYVPTATPSVKVVSVDSTTLPVAPTGNLSTPDVTIDTSSAVTLTVQASYIPVGTVLTLHVFSDNNMDQTVQTTALAGTLQSSQATASVTFPSGYSLNYVKATWTATN